MRSTFTGPGISVPIIGKHCIPGKWQQIVGIGQDNRTRTRRVIVQVIGNLTKPAQEWAAIRFLSFSYSRSAPAEPACAPISLPSRSRITL
ncbi:MAG: hypothetical protein EA360_08760 [Balneolaceae bacterium]|nr:MAG: hypothetical protein EA360_08760 [Balneolaceae bacterium]